ncbi:MAG: hypothetical protein NXH73_10305 [Flavobacteriaceae bacterium]|nr:hypothetical protein [Flavobacteriaceae bacterium]
MNHKFFIGIFLFFSSNFAVFPQENGLHLPIEDTLYQEKSFSENLSEKYTGRDFQYEDMEGVSQNFISRFFNWFFNKISDLFGFEVNPGLIKTFEIIFYALLTLGALFIIIKLLFGKEISTFRKQEAVLNNWRIEEETLEKSDLDGLLSEAIKNKDYRFAIRYLHLKVLQSLSRSGMIQWHYEKTNIDYKKEIQDHAIKQDFERAAYLFDYVWYGEFIIDEAAFENANSQFKNLLNKIKKYG